MFGNGLFREEVLALSFGSFVCVSCRPIGIIVSSEVASTMGAIATIIWFWGITMFGFSACDGWLCFAPGLGQTGRWHRRWFSRCIVIISFPSELDDRKWTYALVFLGHVMMRCCISIYKYQVKLLLRDQHNASGWHSRVKVVIGQLYYGCSTMVSPFAWTWSNFNEG